MNTTQLTENWLNATMKSQRLEKERDALQARLKLAEGLAEIIEGIQWVVMLDGYVRHCTEFRTGDFSVSHAFCHSCGEFHQNTITCRLKQALAAWRAAKGE